MKKENSLVKSTIKWATLMLAGCWILFMLTAFCVFISDIW